jgi:hypothetical protein
MSFLEKKFASENFRFYLECRRYKELDNLGERKEQAVAMVREFLKNGSEYEVCPYPPYSLPPSSTLLLTLFALSALLLTLQVNLESELRDLIFSRYKKAPVDLFDNASAHAAGMMKEKLAEFKLYLFFPPSLSIILSSPF